ncbi:MAG: DEAD/DEAH box helicase family protein, partial [Clostridiales bacterium]|nr:DEAD/DEAH box helicase family protein [Clostridiales bacterium]
MKLQFKHQKFQADAAKAVVDVFAGQPYLIPTYMMDKGYQGRTTSGEAFSQMTLTETQDFTGWANQRLVPELSDRIILEQLQKVQRTNQIAPSPKLEGHYNLTIEMETGVGKTYTYIKTMYELNKHYGWSKFIVVVPSVAIREGVYKSFEMTQEHFSEEYGKKIRFFIYNSAQLTEIDRFASDSSINVMIINSQAFNARGKDARRIYMKLDEFRSRRPIDIIAKTNPILIIDEPQSVEGKQTKERLKEFNPLMTLRYSATHRADSIYNMVYRLDAMEAYNKRLVKKIAVKGITESGSTATESYIYLQSINLSKADPTATIQFDFKGATSIRKVTKTVGIGFNLYDNSNGMEEYRDNYVVKAIDGRDDSIEFLNGVKLYAGDVIGKVSEDQLRRLQIRETILSHIERERQLFYKGIKVLSLFFIDEVSHYKQYDAAGQPVNGIFAQMFEEEYQDVVSTLQMGMGEDAYFRYLNSITPAATHAGYFSIDKKGRMTNSKLGDKKARTSDDIDAYDLIMKNKELLLDRDPKRSPVRFIFSHSALREGWDNPNVFQICTLKQSSSDVRKRQEVGRGLRLCVNQDGERMDTNVLGNDVHNINVLTVIASESYDSFAKGLQTELADAVADRPRAVTADLFVGKAIKDENGNEQIIDRDTAQAIYFDMVVNGYVDRKGALTDKYYADKANNEIKVAEEVADSAASVIDIVDSVYDSRAMQPENARSNNVELKVDPDKLAMPQFKELWERINGKSVYIVDFDTDELVQKAIDTLNRKLRVS